MPIIIHNTKRAHVSKGKENICDRQITIPAIGTNGTHGVLNGRGVSGCVLRKKSIPPHTITKAKRVPILTNSPNMLIGSAPAMMAAAPPVMMVVIYGVLKRLCTLEKDFGKSPSFDIAKKMRGCPISRTSITELKPAMAPIFTNIRNQPIPSPIRSMASAMGADTFN